MPALFPSVYLRFFIVNKDDIWYNKLNIFPYIEEIDSVPFTIDDFKKLNLRLEQITSQKVEEFEISSDTPPTLDDLPDSNKAYSLAASILFIDIRKSTQLTETSQAKSMVKVYRAFMRLAVSCVRANGGVTRQFLGDRIMGIFLDSLDTDGKVIESSADKAVKSAQAMQTCIDYALNKHLKANVSGKTIACGIGIDCGKVLLTKVGMYGVEKDDSKENETDCVWVGNCTNRASKYSDLADGCEIFISEQVFRNLSSSLKPDDVWTPAAKHKGTVLFDGYISANNYLDFSNELGEPVSIGPSDNEDSFNLAAAVKQIEDAWKNIAVKEGQLKVLEAKLENKSAELDKQADNNKRAELVTRINTEQLNSSQSSFYELLRGYLEYSHCKTDYVSSMGYEFWIKLIDEVFAFGTTIGKSKEDVISQNDCQLIGIYDYYKLYNKAYEAMVIMAERNGHWICINRNTVLWAKEQSIIWKLRGAIEARLKDYSKPCNRDNFNKALSEIKSIVGY